MARPRSDDKRTAILAAAARVFVKQGLGAPTAAIAKEAKVANGSLFTYFPTKSELFNQLYLDIKTDMASSALEGVPERAALREQFSHAWMNWMRWARENAERRKVLAMLGQLDELTPATREAGHKVMAPMAMLMERARVSGRMRETPFMLVASIMNAVADATMDFIVQNPANADVHAQAGFDGLWRMLE